MDVAFLAQKFSAALTGLVGKASMGGSEPDIASSAVMATTGAHAHRIGGGFGSGGDAETRPKNVAVNYIIKM